MARRPGRFVLHVDRGKGPALRGSVGLPIAAVAVAVLLSACGASVPPSTGVRGAQTSAAPSPSSSVADAAHRPKITLPSDLHVTIDNTSLGDPVKDAIWADTTQRVLALDAAIANDDQNSATVAYYSAGLGEVAAQGSIRAFAANGHSLTGTERYYAPDITLHGDTATLNYCADDSKAFDKVRATGKVLITPVDKNSYVRYLSEVQRNSTGIWQTTNIVTQIGAAQCQP